MNVARESALRFTDALILPASSTALPSVTPLLPHISTRFRATSARERHIQKNRYLCARRNNSKIPGKRETVFKGDPLPFQRDNHRDVGLVSMKSRETLQKRLPLAAARLVNLEILNRVTAKLKKLVYLVGRLGRRCWAGGAREATRYTTINRSRGGGTPVAAGEVSCNAIHSQSRERSPLLLLGWRGRHFISARRTNATGPINTKDN